MKGLDDAMDHLANHLGDPVLLHHSQTRQARFLEIGNHQP